MSYLTKDALLECYRKLCEYGDAKEIKDGDRVPLQCIHLIPMHECQEPECEALRGRLIELEKDAARCRKV